jgi:hypothetical protein
MIDSTNGEDLYIKYDICDDITVSNLSKRLCKTITAKGAVLFVNGKQLCLTDKLCDTTITSTTDITYIPQFKTILEQYTFPYTYDEQEHRKVGSIEHTLQFILDVITQHKCVVSEGDVVKIMSVQIYKLEGYEYVTSETRALMENIIAICDFSELASLMLRRLLNRFERIDYI